MPIKVVSFGGRLGFWLRVKLPKVSSWGYLTLLSYVREQKTADYIKMIMEKGKESRPIFVNIETINRCNGKCSFCPASCDSETRPFKIMDYELFGKIIKDLQDMNYCGVLSLYVNNEPFMDNRIIDMLNFARKKLPNAIMLLFTNGTLITPEKLTSISNAVDIMFINNYNTSYDLIESNQVIFDFVKKNHETFKNMDIVIQRRYSHEVLANRAGTAPNKPASKKIYKHRCIMPYTDVTVYPDGVVGLCCNDTKEKTKFGNVKDNTILEIFHGKELKSLREKLVKGRCNYEFCQHCDVIDSGIRLRMAKELRDENARKK